MDPRDPRKISRRQAKPGDIGVVYGGEPGVEVIGVLQFPPGDAPKSLDIPFGCWAEYAGPSMFERGFTNWQIVRPYRG